MATRYSVSPRHGKRTRRLVAVAKRHGIEIPRGLKVDSNVWGPAHIKLAKAVQQKLGLKNQTGAPTLELRRYLFPKITKREKATRYALSQVGIREQPMGSNSGPDVDRYTGDRSEAWCGHFVEYCGAKAGINLPRFYYPRARNWADYLPRVSIADAKRGDVVIFRWRSGSFHVARLLDVIDVPSGRYVKTVDGNRSDRVGVFLTKASNVYAIVREPEK